jgi:hypothetical protein
MVLRRCLAGALAVGGTLAAAGCTSTPTAQPGNTASNPAPAIATAPVGRTHGRRRMDPGGTGTQLVATGAVLGVVMASEVSGQTRRVAGPRPRPERLRRTHGTPPGSLPGRQLAHRRDLAREGRLVGRSLRRGKHGHRRHASR